MNVTLKSSVILLRSSAPLAQCFSYCFTQLLHHSCDDARMSVDCDDIDRGAKLISKPGRNL